MKYGLFLGCNVPAIRPDVEKAMRLSLPGLGLELVEMEGSVCCPAFGTFPSADETASLAITAWNLSIAEEKGVTLLTQCGSCYSSLRIGRHRFLENGERQKRVNELLKVADKQYKGKATAHHIIDALYNNVGPDKISSMLTKRLDGVNAIVQYPCHTLYPSEILGFDDPGRPHMLKELVEALGANVQGYSRELQCCGGAGGFTHVAHADSLKFAKKKFDAIKKETDADLIVVSCITCLMHMDKVQTEFSKENGKYSIPVFDYAQILALCMGFDPNEVATISFVPRDRIIKIFQ